MSTVPTIVIPAPGAAPFGMPFDAHGLNDALSAFVDAIDSSVEGRILRGAIRSVIAGLDPALAGWEPEYEYAQARQNTETLELDDEEHWSRWGPREMADHWVWLEGNYLPERWRAVVVRRIKQVRKPEIVP